MASTRSFLLIPVTLCLFLLVLAVAEQGTAITTDLLVISGKALCKSNSSRIISNAPVQLVINNATVPGGSGRTTSDGRILITVNLNSTEQLAAVSNGSSKAFIVAPPHACGAPSLPAGVVVAAELQPIAMATISDDHDDDAGSSVQRPAAIAPADTLLVATTNKGDAAGAVHHLVVAVAQVAEFSCLTLVRFLFG